MTERTKREYNQLTEHLCKTAWRIILEGNPGPYGILGRVGKRQRYCRTANGKSVVFVRDSKRRQVRRRNIKYCQKRTCPFCCRSIAAKQQKKILDVVKGWSETGGHFLVLTLTLPHDKIDFDPKRSKRRAAESLREADELLRYCLRAFSQSYKRKLKNKLGLVSQLTRIETTLGGEANTLNYHTHAHLLLAVSRNFKLPRRKGESYRKYTKRQAKINLDLSAWCYEAWRCSLIAVLKKYPDKFGEVRRRIAQGRVVLKEPFIEEVEKRSTDSLGRRRKLNVSLVRGGAVCEVAYGNKGAEVVARYLAKELTMTHTKLGKEGRSMTWLQGLVQAHGEAWFKFLFKHYVVASYKFPNATWGRVPHDKGKNGTISFHNYIIQKHGIGHTRPLAEDLEIIGTMDVDTYNRIAPDPHFHEALDQVAAGGSVNALENLGMRRGENEELRAIEEEVAELKMAIGIIRKTKNYTHKSIKKLAPKYGPYVANILADLMELKQANLGGGSVEAEDRRKNLETRLMRAIDNWASGFRRRPVMPDGGKDCGET